MPVFRESGPGIFGCCLQGAAEQGKCVPISANLACVLFEFGSCCRIVIYYGHCQPPNCQSACSHGRRTRRIVRMNDVSVIGRRTSDSGATPRKRASPSRKRGAFPTSMWASESPTTPSRKTRLVPLKRSSLNLPFLTESSRVLHGRCARVSRNSRVVDGATRVILTSQRSV
jgi:hypothetical protein